MKYALVVVGMVIIGAVVYRNHPSYRYRALLRENRRQAQDQLELGEFTPMIAPGSFFVQMHSVLLH